MAERLCPNTGDATWDRYAGEAGEIEERAVPDSNNGHTINSRWNGDYSSSSDVAGNGDLVTTSRVGIVGRCVN